jgi:hypothetical protein
MKRFPNSPFSTPPMLAPFSWNAILYRTFTFTKKKKTKPTDLKFCILFHVLWMSLIILLFSKCLLSSAICYCVLWKERMIFFHKLQNVVPIILLYCLV